MNNEFDDIFSNVSEENVETLSVDEPPKKKFSINLDLKNDKVLLVQLILIGVWAILTAVIYFFGYNLFSPFINV